MSLDDVLLGADGRFRIGSTASEAKDGHGRVIRTTERVRQGTGFEERHVLRKYIASGEVTKIKRQRGSDTVSRTMVYDTLGRMVENHEASFDGPLGHGWRYAYNDAGDLVGTSDARGCGVNFHYDAAGRLKAEDYWPCENHHAPYTTAPEVAYWYDEPDDDEASFQTSLCQTSPFMRGRLVSVTDRASKSMTCYDGRGRALEVAKKLRAPTGEFTDPWFHQFATYDGADRPITETTSTATVTTDYSQSGRVKSVDSSHGELVKKIRRDPDGLVQELQYGDGASTTTGFMYDDLRRLRNVTTYRAKPVHFASGTTHQLLLQDEELTYDRVGNPVEIRDWRMPDEWPAGFKPVTRKMRYDDLYRLSQVDYIYPSGADTWVDPYQAEVFDSNRPQPSPRANFTGAKRPLRQGFSYDWLGNTATTSDDANAFYDRSLGTISNAGYQLVGADNLSASGSRTGELGAQYDAAGNLIELDVNRNGPCIGACTYQHFAYQWDEVGRLVRAKRWDSATAAGLPNADLEYAYDASDQRIRKTSGPDDPGARHTLYVFGSLEHRLASYDAVTQQYDLSDETEVLYLFANGVRLGRVVHVTPPDGVPNPSDPTTRLFLELGDHLGSTNTVLDHTSGELVERSTAFAYGAVESDYRPDRWGEFREDYRFTGKEEDVEVGLIYFGKRFYAPLLQRWVSADPLAVHVPGEADLNLYAYVHGKALIAVDPVGFDENDYGGELPPGGEPSPETTSHEPPPREFVLDDVNIYAKSAPVGLPALQQLNPKGSVVGLLPTTNAVLHDPTKDPSPSTRQVGLALQGCAGLCVSVNPNVATSKVENGLALNLAFSVGISPSLGVSLQQTWEETTASSVTSLEGWEVESNLTLAPPGIGPEWSFGAVEGRTSPNGSVLYEGLQNSFGVGFGIRDIEGLENAGRWVDNLTPLQPDRTYTYGINILELIPSNDP